MQGTHERKEKMAYQTMKILFQTTSLCLVCKKRVPAAYMQYPDGVRLEKFCPVHGVHRVDIWRGNAKDFLKWCEGWHPEPYANPDCPYVCGLCEKHQTPTCCVILDITNRCNLRCPYCFADGGTGEDMPFEEVCDALDDIYAKGRRFLHISGGEPTVHPDILKILSYAKEKGFAYIQLNTNGIRIAQDSGFAKALAQAGTSCVFLQFDGMTDEVYQKVRGQALLDQKMQAIRYCDEAQLGVVLVPTVIAGINDDQIGPILQFAYAHMPAVRGVHYQPVTYTGRFEQGKRITIPEMLSAIESQSDGLIRRDQILPSACDAPLCGFHAEFQRKEDGLHCLTSEDSEGCCSDAAGPNDVVKNQLHVKNRWTRIPDGSYPPGSMGELRKTISDQSFCISGMLFQDPDTLDLARTMHCSVHVYRDGHFIPFCVFHNR